MAWSPRSSHRMAAPPSLPRDPATPPLAGGGGRGGTTHHVASRHSLIYLSKNNILKINTSAHYHSICKAKKRFSATEQVHYVYPDLYAFVIDLHLQYKLCPSKINAVPIIAFSVSASCAVFQHLPLSPQSSSSSQS